MKNLITSFVGLDVHKDSIAVGVARAGREAPHFVGTVAPQWSALSKALPRPAFAEWSTRSSTPPGFSAPANWVSTPPASILGQMLFVSESTQYRS